MNWREQLDAHSNVIMTNVSAQLAVLHSKIESLESTGPVLSKPAKQEKVITELAGLMDLLVIRAENMNESTHEFNDFKKQQQAVNDSMQSTLEELKRQVGLKETGGNKTKNDAAAREIATLKAKLAESLESEGKARNELFQCQKSAEIARMKLLESQKAEEKAQQDLVKKNIEQMVGKSLYFKAGEELSRLKSELEEVKDLLRKTNLACQRKSQEIKDLTYRLSEYEYVEPYY